MPSLGNDLQTLRNRKDLSVEDIKQSTKIPVPILQSIEDDSIFDQIDNNTTYTRSYVRSYARALGVEEKEILKALNQVQTGTYKGSLLGENEAETPETEDAQDKDPQNEENSAAPSKSETAPDQDGVSKKKPQKKPARSRYETSPEDWDWVHVDTTAKVSTKSSNKNWLLIVLIIVALIVAGFLIYFYYFTASDTDTLNSAENSQTTMNVPPNPSDSFHGTRADSQQAAQNRKIPAETPTLSDTLSLQVYAADGKLEPVRIYTDITSHRNPYWVPRGDTIQFKFINTIRVQANNQYDRLQLLFNLHNIPDFYSNYYSRKADAVVLNRSLFKKHPEWLPANEAPSSR